VKLPEDRSFVWGLVLAGIIELVTIFFRFGLGMESTRDTTWIAAWTFGLRIHHGYPGLLLLLIGAMLAPGGKRNLALIIGTGLLVSDLAHHFLVLWPITGSPHFDLWYPK
jgi:hypothetical protein